MRRRARYTCRFCWHTMTGELPDVAFEASDHLADAHRVPLDRWREFVSIVLEAHEHARQGELW